MSRVSIAAEPVDIAALRRALERPDCGGLCVFEGWVRETNDGRQVSGLDYEAYTELALSEGERIIDEAVQRFGIADARCMHRVGRLAVGDTAVWIGVTAPHRDAAFRACRYIIDAIKQRLPIWKKEHYLVGESAWVACSHGPANEHAHAPHANVPTTFIPDYSRQTRLVEIGAAGQARLGASRVLVIGAGGLGCPVLSYLAGAGVGALGIVDSDVLEASNLHRQTLYAAADVGQLKVELAARRLAALNPAVSIETFAERLAADTITAIFDRYDLVVECTDDIDSKYLSSDAAVLTGTPILFASVYQYEGQLHAYVPRGHSPCLRCLWPLPPAAGVLATCEQAGVLGPVPGILGAMQAVEAIRMILDLPGQLDESLLLVSLLDHGMRKIGAQRCPPCLEAGRCVHVRDLSAWPTAGGALELAFPSLQLALDGGYTIVDIRDADEILAHPLSIPALPIQSVLNAVEAPDEKRYLLICARGRRSYQLALQLRREGLARLHSFKGGVAALPPRDG